MTAAEPGTTERRSRRGARRDLRFSFDPKTLRAPLLKWYREGRREHPWRVLFETHRDPYHVWVSEIMLQQTVIKAVLPVYDRFLKAFPDVRALAAAPDEAVRQAVRGLGYYRRFRMMHEAAQELARRGFAWPTTFDGWKELPGIGDYTAAAISSIAFGQPAAVVDGNVERVFCRLLDLREPPNQPALKPAFKALAQDFLEPAAPGDFNQALMELGQRVCTPVAPACDLCPLAPGCLARQRGSQALAPAPKAQPEAKDVALRLLIVRDAKGRVGLRERPATARFLKGTWGFVTGIRREGGACAADGWDGEVPEGRALGTVGHSITHHRIKAAVEEAPEKNVPVDGAWRWLEPAAVEENLVSNLDRKAWHLYEKQSASPRWTQKGLFGGAGDANA